MQVSHTRGKTGFQEMVLRFSASRGGGVQQARNRALYRCLMLAGFLLGVSLLAAANGAGPVGSNTTSSVGPVLQTRSVTPPVAAAPPGRGLLGVGGMDTHSTGQQDTAASCSGIFDPTCWAQAMGQALAKWIAQTILSTLQPIIDQITHNSLNFVTQTPLLTSSGGLDTTIGQVWTWAIGIVDAAVGIFIIIGGYTIMMRGQTQFVIDVGLRLLFALVAANFSLVFMRIFIDIENALCDGIIHVAQLSILTNVVSSIFQGNILSTNLILFALAIILGVLVFLLLWQMLVRLALLAALIGLAGPALLTLASPFTMAWGRLWLGLFSGTLFVQFFQVVILALGSMLVSTLTVTDVFHIDKTILTLLVCIAVFSLVLQIPGLMRQWAIRPLVQSATSTLEGVQGRAEFLSRMATVLALRGV